MNYARMEEQLMLHEGLRLKPYLDTEGNWTVGVGYNIDGRGWEFFEQTVLRRCRPVDGAGTETARVTKEESLKVLRADIKRVEKAVRTYYPGYDSLGDVRQRVFVDMSFNMGFKALGFKNAIAAAKKNDWSACAREVWKSKWAGQVGDGPGQKEDRADRLTKMLLTNIDYTK